LQHRDIAAFFKYTTAIIDAKTHRSSRALDPPFLPEARRGTPCDLFDGGCTPPRIDWALSSELLQDLLLDALPLY
jgi:hypothetical protein